MGASLDTAPVGCEAAVVGTALDCPGCVGGEVVASEFVLGAVALGAVALGAVIEESAPVLVWAAGVVALGIADGARFSPFSSSESEQAQNDEKHSVDRHSRENRRVEIRPSEPNERTETKGDGPPAREAFRFDMPRACASAERRSEN